MSSPLALPVAPSLVLPGAASWWKATLPRIHASRISASESGEPEAGVAVAVVVAGESVVAVARRLLDRESRVEPGLRATLAHTRSATPVMAGPAVSVSAGFCSATCVG